MDTDSVFGLSIFGQMSFSGPFQTVPGWIEIVPDCELGVTDSAPPANIGNPTQIPGQSVFGQSVFGQVIPQTNNPNPSDWTNIARCCQ